MNKEYDRLIMRLMLMDQKELERTIREAKTSMYVWAEMEERHK